MCVCKLFAEPSQKEINKDELINEVNGFLQGGFSSITSFFIEHGNFISSIRTFYYWVVMVLVETKLKN